MTKIIGSTSETLEERLELICKEALKRGFGTVDDPVIIELDDTKKITVTFASYHDSKPNMLTITFHLEDWRMVVTENIDSNERIYQYENDCFYGWNRIYILTVIEHISYEFLKVWS